MLFILLKKKINNIIIVMSKIKNKTNKCREKLINV